MKTKYPLWEQVEIELASWCAQQEFTTDSTHKCNCPRIGVLKEMPEKALRTVLKDLKANRYTGSFQKYLKL